MFSQGSSPICMTILEQLTANFYRWEQLGRGVQLFEAPEQMEPPFISFPGDRVVFDGPVHLGRKEFYGCDCWVMSAPSARMRAFGPAPYQPWATPKVDSCKP